MNRLLLSAILLVVTSPAFSQKFPLYIGSSLQHAVGEFTTTHSFGVGIDCGPSNRWFEFKKNQKLKFDWKAGYNFYFGKKVTTSGFKNKYPGYSFIHAFAGIQFNPLKKVSFRLLAGPALGLYNGTTRFNLGVELGGNYLIKRDLAVGPLLLLIKENGTDAIWTVGLRGMIKIQ